MALEYKDYYATLGVARDAGDEEIRKAFRRLARQYHPDVAKDKRAAEERFKEINEAYEVLGDPEKRRRYDELGAELRGGWRSARGAGADSSGGFEFEFGGTGFSDFFEQLFGRASGRRRGRPFAGQPGMAGEEEEEPAARGRDVQADILVTLDEVLHGAVRPVTVRTRVACQRCQGTGSSNGGVCPHCQGGGRVTKTESYRVKIPAGVREGQRLRLAGHGQAGAAAGHAGDLYLRVRLAQHPDFRVDEDHLRYNLELAPWEAALGVDVTVPALDGSVSIRIPPGTQSGQRFRLRGRGIPGDQGRGDLLVEVSIQVPRESTAQERALWQQLSRVSSFRPRE